MHSSEPDSTIPGQFMQMMLAHLRGMMEAARPELLLCSCCQTPRQPGQTYCNCCGLIFPSNTEAVSAPHPSAAVASRRIKERYELGELLLEQGAIGRFRGVDYGQGDSAPVAVLIVRSNKSRDSSADMTNCEDDVLIPTFDGPQETGMPATGEYKKEPCWPSPGWEEVVLEKARHVTLPRVLDRIEDDSWDYLVLEAPGGRCFWDAWDDPEATTDQRYTWLEQIAAGLHKLHQAGAIVAAMRPDQFIITAEGQVRFQYLFGLLPLPMPADRQIMDTRYRAPELILSPEVADGRADLYGFGAMLYSLQVGRELTEMDFERPGVPKGFTSQFPDAHPLLGRLLSKTFCRDLKCRFPTVDASQKDPTGFVELMQTLSTCRKSLDRVRLDMAAWTTTGMVRTVNEDAFALLHAIDSQHEELAESALIVLADGMGGYEAGEVAAALAVQTIRNVLLQWPPFATLCGNTRLGTADQNPETIRNLLKMALDEANRQVNEAARSAAGQRGMGCTAEIVYIHGRRLNIGHVGDCRTYHLQDGKLKLLTRDQTLAQRLVELGQLTKEEAENHPRKSELQQAIGCHEEIQPEFYHANLKPGDWLVVCSDGLPNHINALELQQMLLSESTSAEMAARRLVNFTNLKGGLDNATVVVIRVT